MSSATMKVKVTSVFERPIEYVWQDVQKPEVLLEVCMPLAKIISADPEGFPETWLANKTYKIKTFLFGKIPAGLRDLHIESIDNEKHEMQTREKDALCKKWDHKITAVAESPTTTRYTDEIEIDAGPMTPFVCTWATFFYKHRHNKWISLNR